MGASYAAAPAIPGALPSSVLFNSRLASPGRHHSEYVYDPTRPVPQYYQDEIKRSILETSLRGSQLSGSNFRLPGRTAEAGGPVLGTAAHSMQAASVAPKVADVQATLADPNATVVRADENVKKDGRNEAQAASAPAAAKENEESPESSGYLRPKELEPAVAADGPEVPGDQDMPVPTEADPDTAAAAGADEPLQVFPATVLFRPCAPNSYQLAKLRIRNAGTS